MNQSRDSIGVGNKGSSVGLMFPEYHGESLRPLGPALLWFGQLICGTGPFVSPHPYEVLKLLQERARARDLPIARLFGFAIRELAISAQRAMAATAGMEPLDSRIARVAMVGPGGGEFKRLRRSRGTGRCHNGDQTAPSRAIHTRAFGLQKGCRTGSGRRVLREESLQMSGSAYGIRTRVTAVRGRPEGLAR